MAETSPKKEEDSAKKANGINMTMVDRGVPQVFNLTFSKRSIFLRRNVTFKIVGTERKTAITLNRSQLSSIRLDEGPDFRTATLLGIGGAVAMGVTGHKNSPFCFFCA